MIDYLKFNDNDLTIGRLVSSTSLVLFAITSCNIQDFKDCLDDNYFCLGWRKRQSSLERQGWQNWCKCQRRPPSSSSGRASLSSWTWSIGHHCHRDYHDSHDHHPYHGHTIVIFRIEGKNIDPEGDESVTLLGKPVDKFLLLFICWQSWASWYYNNMITSDTSRLIIFHYHFFDIMIILIYCNFCFPVNDTLS